MIYIEFWLHTIPLIYPVIHIYKHTSTIKYHAIMQNYLCISYIFYNLYSSFMCLNIAQYLWWEIINSSLPGQNGRHLGKDIFKCISWMGMTKIPIRISLKLVPRSPVGNKPALVQVMAWCRSGDRPLTGPMLTQFTYAFMSILRFKQVFLCSAEFRTSQTMIQLKPQSRLECEGLFINLAMGAFCARV